MTRSSTGALATSPLTEQQLTDALRRHGTIDAATRVATVRSHPIGTGQMADSFRVELGYSPTDAAGPSSLVAKLPAADPMTSQVGRASGVYMRENNFYTNLVPQLPDVSVPALLGTFDAGGEHGLLLEDLRETKAGDQLVGASVEQLALTVTQLGNLQAPMWGDTELGSAKWLQRRTGTPIPDRKDRYERACHRLRDELREVLTPAQHEVITRFGESCDDWSRGISGPFTLVHHDLGLDNLLFAPDRAYLVDWQTLGWGSPAWDLAYLLSSSASPELRRDLEHDFVRRHAEDLASRGISDWPGDRAWLEYRRMAFSNLLVTLPAAGELPDNVRGRRMFHAMWRRTTTMVLDLDALELLPC